MNIIRDAFYSCFCIGSSTVGHGSAGQSRHKTHNFHPQTLPIECLARIFIECSQSNLPIIYLPPRQDFYPWRLGHVCFHWRRTLWNSPGIWSTIYATTDRNGHLVEEMLGYILSRTTGLISLSLSYYSYTKPRMNDIIIASFSHRFKALTLSPVSHHLLNVLFNLDPDASSHLKTLYLFNVYPNRRLRLPTNVHQRFQNLHQLGISGNTSIMPYLPHFPLAHLTHLSITGRMLSQTIVHLLLKQCTFLIFANFSICKEIEGAPQHKTGPFTAFFIERLDLISDFELDWRSLLDPLSLPSLTAFAYMDLSRSPSDLHNDFPHAMYTLIDRSNCSIDFLSLSSHYGSFPTAISVYNDISHILPLMPNLTTFVSDYVIEPTIITMIHEWLPSLEIINWRVKPDGLHIFLDTLDDYISRPPSPSSHFPSFISILCLGGNGFISARERYLEKYRIYEEAVVRIKIQNADYHDLRLLDRVEMD